MKNVIDLDLHELPIDEQLFADDPDPHMLISREQHPWLAKSKFGIVITEFAAIDDILRMDDKLKTPAAHVVDIMGGEGTNWARFQYECLVAQDGSSHERIRNAVSKAFLPKAVNSYQQRIRNVISDLLDEWAPKRQFDFEDFASRFPVAVMFGFLGIPRKRIEDVKYWLEMFGQSFCLDRSLFPLINESFNNLWNFAENLVKERKASGNPGEPDVLDVLIAGEAEGVLSATEVGDLILFMFAGGYDTSKNQLGHIMNFMLDHTDLWERCAVDRKFCDDVVNEALRHSGVATSYRNVAVEFQYRDVNFPAGTILIFPLGIACRYSDLSKNAIEFDPCRSDGKRLTVFGRGMHMCLGQFLAKLQMAEGIHLMAQRLKNPRRDGDLVWRLFPGVWGPKQLPIAFDHA
ncbi:MAG TPA: cytochrome P450 [Spongiibacteraceae bacterium]|nr:cytochrome P450 [Spongiibacteraceae bacterium]